MEHARMISAARSKARRIAKKTDIPYQKALDLVAQQLGRQHWGAFMTDPVEVPRDEQGFPHDWNMTDSDRPDELRGAFLMPRYNALGDAVMPRGEPKQDEHLAKIAEILVPIVANKSGSYFEDRARAMTHAFLRLEVIRAREDARQPSIPAMVSWINDGLRRASEESDRRRKADRGMRRMQVDALTMWIDEMVVDHGPKDASGIIVREIGSLSEMSPNERSGILGTMDKGLLAFKNDKIRALNS